MSTDFRFGLAQKQGSENSSPGSHWLNHMDSTNKENLFSDDTDDTSMQKSQLTSHFMVPNLSSILYEFTNREKDRIERCFRVGNFHSLRDLPKHLLPGNVSFMSVSKINENLYSQKEERTYIELQRGGGYFSKFQWLPEPYDLFM
jgi:hypothetical protein